MGCLCAALAFGGLVVLIGVGWIVAPVILCISLMGAGLLGFLGVVAYALLLDQEERYTGLPVDTPLPTVIAWEQRLALNAPVVQIPPCETCLPAVVAALPTLTPQEAAQALGVSQATVRKRLRQGTLRGWKEGRRWRVLLAREQERRENSGNVC